MTNRYQTLKIATCLAVAMLATACSSLSVNERQVENRILAGGPSSSWSGVIVTSENGTVLPYTIDIQDVEAKFQGNDSFHDVELNILGNLEIEHTDYQVDSPISIVLGARSETLPEKSMLVLTSSYAKAVSFPRLYAAFSKDLEGPITESLNKISDAEIRKAVIIDYSSQKSKADRYARNKGISDYEDIRINDGNSISILFESSETN